MFLTFSGCGGGGNVSSKSDAQKNIFKRDYSNQDSDNDYIPDNIEALIGTNINNSDQNNNGIIDGLESNGNFDDTLFNKEWFIY